MNDKSEDLSKIGYFYMGFKEVQFHLKKLLM